MNINDARIVDFGKQKATQSKEDYESLIERRLEDMNREERRKNGTTPWVRVSPKVAAVVKAGHSAMKEKKRRRKIEAASRARNR